MQRPTGLPTVRVGRRRHGAGLALVATLLLSACGGDAVRGPQSSLAPPGVAVSVPRDGLSAATLDVENGSSQIDVTTGALGGDLVRATTPTGGGQNASLTRSGDVVAVRLDSVPGGSGANRVSLGLEAGVSWIIRITGGSTTLTIDTVAGGLRELDLLAGASLMSLTLGPPDGTVAITVRGGASRLTLRRPVSIPVRVHGAGVGSLTVDGRQEGSTGPFTVMTDGWVTASSRYDVAVEAGVGALSIEGAGTWRLRPVPADGADGADGPVAIPPAPPRPEAAIPVPWRATGARGVSRCAPRRRCRFRR